MNKFFSYFKKSEVETPPENEKHPLTQKEIDAKIKEINNEIRDEADSHSYMSKDFFNFFSLRYSSNQNKNPSMFKKFLYAFIKVLMIILLTIIGILFFILIGSFGVAEEDQIKSFILNLVISSVLLIIIWFLKNFFESKYF